MINWQNGTTPINETNMNKLVQEDMITDAYSSSNTYAVGDYCIYENTLYKCTTAISTAEEFDSSKWTVASISYEFKRITNELSNKLNSNKVIQESGTASTSNVYSSKAIQNILNKIHPVGTIKMTTVNTNPGTYLPGTWVAWGSGRVPVGVDTSQTEFNTVEKKGGEKKHQLTVNEMPSHQHDVGIFGDAGGPFGYNIQTLSIGSQQNVTTEAKGGDQAHNNLQPYITCYMWKRTA